MVGKRVKKAFFRFFSIATLLLYPPSLPAAQTLRISLPDSGTVVWETPIPESASFILRHRNSIYGARVEERFQVEPGGTIRLTAVKTPSPAVLEYYGLEAVSTDWIPLFRSINGLNLLVSSRGEVALVFQNREINLSQVLPDGTRIEIRVIPAVE